MKKLGILTLIALTGCAMEDQSPTMNALVLACRLLIGAVFIWAGLAKIGDLSTFAADWPEHSARVTATSTTFCMQ